MMRRADYSSTPFEAQAPRAVDDVAAPAVMQVLPRLVAGGVERGTIDIAAALVQSGWRAIVASEGGPMVRELERAGAIHLTLPVASKNPLVIHRNVARLIAAVRAHRVDLVHARSRAPAWSAYYAARRTGAKFVTTFHGAYKARGELKRWYNGIMARGERVIAISEFIANHVVDRYGCDPARIRVIPRGVDLLRFDPQNVSAERVIQLAREWRLPDGVPVIMLPGRLTRLKGHPILIEAMAQLGRRDMCCLLVGGDDGHTRYRRELENLIRARGVESMVRLVAHCRDMPAAFMLADVVVSASVEPEAFGRVAAEAQAMGRPVVASDHGGSREVVVPGKTGWLVKPGDAAALAAAIDEALALDADARALLATQASERVRAEFSRERMCEATLGVYAELLDAAREASPAS
jgi:glycosyltransferase involved in cell wall biosynthesis